MNLTEERFEELMSIHRETMSGVNSNMWKDIIDRLKVSDEKLDKLIVQTTKTNGSVCTLKEEMKEVKEWKEKHCLEAAEMKGRGWGIWKMATLIGGILLAISSFASGIAQNVFANIISNK